MKLTNASLKKLLGKPGRHADGGGLFFRTLGGDKAYWVYRYRAGGKEREMSLGPYPELSLIEARAKHAAARKAVVVDKTDPLVKKREAKAAAAYKGVPTFGEAANAYLRAHEAGWRNPKHRDQWRMTLTRYSESIRDTPVDQVDAKAVLRVIEPLWTTIPETASRLRARIEAVLASAQVAGHIDPDRPNPARWRGWLDQMLAKRKARGHHAAMPYADVPPFMASLKAAPGVAASALMFAILCAARSGEVFGATWDEIDLDAGVWTVPPDRMKMGRPHRVPLSAPAVDILRGQLAARGENPHVFPGARPHQPLSAMALAMAMRRLGEGEFTPHGFRSAFRDWAGDKTNFPREAAEAALAHAVGDETEQAYRRGDALDKRRELMDAWASFCFPTPAEVVSIADRRKRS